MADERVMQFRLGVIAIATIAVGVTLVLLFGGRPELFKSSYTVYVKFKDASGVSPGTPVRKFGIAIGRVAKVGFADGGGGALVTVEIDSEVRLRKGETFTINQGLFGDAVIEVMAPQPSTRGENQARVSCPLRLAANYG